MPRPETGPNDGALQDKGRDTRPCAPCPLRGARMTYRADRCVRAGCGGFVTPDRYRRFARGAENAVRKPAQGYGLKLRLPPTDKAFSLLRTRRVSVSDLRNRLAAQRASLRPMSCAFRRQQILHAHYLGGTRLAL